MTAWKNTPKPLPTQERLRELLDYDQETGIFKWRVRPSKNVKAGDVAGCVDDLGYHRITIDGKLYRAHRLAFVWMTGFCPDVIDHIDRDPNNKSWGNLRPATRSENQGNRSLGKDNTSGVKGVSWHAGASKWVAQIGINGRVKHLGCFTDIDDASAAYERAAIAFFGKFACPAKDQKAADERRRA